MGKYTYLIIIAGAGALAYALYKRNAFGALPVACGPESKNQAKRWMAEVMAYKQPEKIEQTTVNQATGMDQAHLMAYANLLRGREEPFDIQNYRANGIGRPQ